MNSTEEIANRKNLETIDQAINYPRWEMPPGFEQKLPLHLLEIATKRVNRKNKETGEEEPSQTYRYRPTVRVRAMSLLVKMSEQNLRFYELLEEIKQTQSDNPTGEIALDDLNDEEIQTLAQASAIRRRLHNRAALESVRDGR